MPSWYVDWDDQLSAYESELAAAERQRIHDNTQPLEGYQRPTDPPCPRHGYGTVNGTCGLCLLEKS
jgi:hypothetical protein